MFLIFAPLLQFELMEKWHSCEFDIFFPTIGLSEFDNVLFGVLCFFTACSIGEFYNSINTPRLDFKIEQLMNDLITKTNFSYISLLYTFFIVIFTGNFTGLLPYTQTITSQLLFTLVLSFITMLTIWLQALVKNKILVLNHFLPEGSPLIINPFIILIEMISNISRLISLSVRLFANMTAGHALLKILAGFGLGALILPGVWKGFVGFAIVIIFIITILEVIIAFLQTYVFITLMLIYINEQS